MRARINWAGSWCGLGIGAALGLAACGGNGSSESAESSAGALAVAGTAVQASAVGGTGGTGAVDTAAAGAPSSSASGATSGGADSAPNAGAAGSAGQGGSGGQGGSAGGDGPAKGGGGGGGTALPGGGAGGAAVSCTGLLFCDDFESYTSGARPSGKWTAQVRGSANAVVDSAMSYSGGKSVHFTGTVNQNSANIIAQGAPVFPIQGNTLFLRMMMYINSYPATSGTHTRFMRIGTNTNGLDGTSYALDTYNGTGIEHVNSGMYRNTSLHLSDAAVKGKWVCWEWELDNTAGPPAGDTGKVMAYLWRDSVAVPLVTTTDRLPWNPIPWQLLEVGLEAYQADTQPGDFWVDDVALDSKRIGCPAK